MMKPPTRPYVYALVDPRDGAVFYIGKGTGRRMFQHQLDAKRGRGAETPKRQRLIEILGAGMTVETRVLGEFTSERAAYAAERRLIAEHKGLTNTHPGGNGNYCGPRGAREDGEAYESPRVTRRKALDMLDRMVPFDQWEKESPSASERAARSWMVKQLRTIVEMCNIRIDPFRLQGSRRGGGTCCA